MLVEAGLVTLSNACFELADKIPEDVQHANVANLPKLFPDIFTAFQMLLLLGWARRRYFVSLFCCYLRSPQPLHQDPQTNPVLRVGA